MPENVVHQNPRCQNFVANPYRRYSQWHKIALPVFWKDYGFWCLTQYEAVDRALRDRRFARLPPPGEPTPPTPPHLQDFAAAEKYSLLSMEPPDHTRLRKMVNSAFVSRHLTKLAPSINAIANASIDSLESGRSSELIHDYATPLALKVITRLLGVPEAAGHQLVSWSHAMVRVYTLTQTHDEEIIANRAAAQFQSFLRKLLSEKRQQAGDDLLRQMLALRNPDTGQPVTDEEIISVTILLLNAGHEATVHQLGNAVFTLLTHYPDDSRADLLNALKDDEKADDIVNECLRFAAPLHLFTRYAQEDMTLDGGIQLACGDQLGLLLAAANRCPLKFSEPDKFRPSRADAAHLSLGAGIHYCVGAQLARMELRIALQVLFRRLPSLQLEKQPVYQDAFHFHGLQRLDVHW